MSETITFSPNAVGSYSECGKGSGGATKLECVQTNDGATTAIYGLNAANWKHETFNFANPTPDQGRIDSVKLYTVCSGIGIGAVYSKGAIFTSGQTLQYGAQHTLENSVWTLYEDIWTTDPWTDVGWTWADLNTLEIGVALKGNSTRSAWCTQICGAIEFTRPNGARAQIIFMW
jgi:hypothetical protein